MTQIKKHKIPHVIIMANFIPDTTKLSKDRWAIFKISKDKDMIDITDEYV